MESLHFRRGVLRPLIIRAGFTLVELLVVLAIIAVVMVVVLTSQSSFNGTLILQNAAYDIALTLRNAQTYGLGSRAVGVTANAGYGIHFQSVPADSFTFFADTSPAPSASNCHGLPLGGSAAPDAQPGDCIYDQNQDQRVNSYTLGNGIIISDFCVYRDNGIGGKKKCASTHPLTFLDVVFARPNPDVFIETSLTGYTYACLTVASPQGTTRSVSIGTSGVITVSASPCL